jgi:hypothetical protein
MNISILFFLLLPGLAASLNREPPKLANYTVAISHTFHQIHNIVYDKQKQDKFDTYIVHDTSKSKMKLWKVKANNYCGTSSLLSNPPVGLKRVSMKSYPGPPP